MQFALAGGAVSVGRFISGRPDCFMVRSAVPDLRAAKGRRILKVVVNVGARQGVPVDVIFVRGAAAVALVNALEQSSNRCELWIASLAQKSYRTAGVRVRVKRAEEPPQLDTLAFCFASAALHRWLMFSIRTGVPALSRVLRNSVGGSIELPDGERGDIYFPGATNDSQWRSTELNRTGIVGGPIR